MWNYTNYANLSWPVPSTKSCLTTIAFTRFSTGDGYDWVSVLAGSSVLLRQSGHTLPKDTVASGPDGTIKVTFTSDSWASDSGFDFSYSCSPNASSRPPPPPPPSSACPSPNSTSAHARRNLVPARGIMRVEKHRINNSHAICWSARPQIVHCRLRLRLRLPLRRRRRRRLLLPVRACHQNSTSALGVEYHGPLCKRESGGDERDRRSHSAERQHCSESDYRRTYTGKKIVEKRGA